MTAKKLLFPILGLALLFSVSCLRKDVSEPDPFGPSNIHITLDVQANPNVLYITSAGRVTSNIQATAKEAGSPLAGQTVFFTIEEGLGEFSDYSRRIAAVTNSQGIASVTYVSPSLAEMPGDRDVLLEVTLQTCAPYDVNRYVWLRLLEER